MVKKKKDDKSIYEQEQVHKKHRGKSDKIAKRIEHKRNKKKIKTHNHEQRTFTKYILKVFKDHKKQIELSKLPFDLDEIEIAIKRIIAHDDKESITRIIDAFHKMEKSPKEISLTKFQNKSIIKDVMKLMRVLKVHQNPNNQMKYSCYHMFQTKHIKARFTTNTGEIIKECLGSYHLFVKALFDFYTEEKKLIEKEKKENDNSNDKDENDDDDNNDDNEKKEEDTLEQERMKIDTEYEMLENEVGQNAFIINRAFHKILRDDQKNKNTMHLKKDHGYGDNDDNEMEDDAVKKGPKPSDFLKMTMSLLNNK